MRVKLKDILNVPEDEYLKCFPNYKKGEVVKEIVEDSYIKVGKKTNKVDFTISLDMEAVKVTEELFDKEFDFKGFILFQKDKGDYLIFKRESKERQRGRWLITDVDISRGSKDFLRTYSEIKYHIREAGAVLEKGLVEKVVAVIGKGILTPREKEHLEIELVKIIEI